MSGPHGLWSERPPPGLPAKMLPWYTLPCPARPQLLATDPSMMFHPRLPAPRAVAFSHGALAPASPDSAGFRCFSRVTSLYHQVWSSHSPAVGPPSSSISSGEAAGQGSKRPGPGARRQGWSASPATDFLWELGEFTAPLGRPGQGDL